MRHTIEYGMAALLLVTGAAASAKPNPARRMNVVLIVCDDLNDYVGHMGGHAQAKTPHMDKLAGSGVSFSRCYSNNPLCAPSRPSFMCGLHPHTSGHFIGKDWHKNEVPGNSRTLSEHLRANGYRTVGSGKVMHHGLPELWDEYAHKADYGPFAFDGKSRVAHPDVPHPFRTIGQTDGSYASLDNVPYADDDDPQSGWISGKWGHVEPLRYNTPDDRDPTPDERNAVWAADRIRQFAKEDSDTPFFLAVGFVRPHTPLHVPQKYFDMYPLESLELPVMKLDDADDTHFKDFYHERSRGPWLYRELVASYPDRETALKTFTQAYLACVTAVDDCIGRVVDALDNSRLKDNTIVVLTSDHGWQMGQKDYLFKWALWEDVCRVPFIVRARGVTVPGGIAGHPVSLIDLYPTLVDLCGLAGDTRKDDRGKPLDGHSLRPFLEDPESGEWDGPDGALTTVFAGEWAGWGADRQHYSIRTERWRYIVYNNGKEELYDHTSDPHEWTNLAASPEHAETKQSLVRQMLDMRGLDALPPPVRRTETGQWFAKLDNNRDGKVTRDEWFAWGRESTKKKGVPFIEEQQLKNFNRWGGDDGTITPEELEKAMK